ncbi:hypothetical protein CVIRNUC_008908 [Coccomyxa viridis]|uniref:Uncharacterized protein n=1 Tax=Coccomyxa viridis TaxID=1274662 RepID=A0AAV1IHL6_9CHLO|nr:hypothetical protein CVIRNUC_008908 [Coccomyxa viridis]
MMDIRSMSPEEIQAARMRLASRKSFFGGSVSTRADSVAPSYKIRQMNTKAAQSKSESKATSTAQQPRKPAAKRPRASADDFGSLEDDDDDEKPGPAVKVGDVWGQYLAAQSRKKAAAVVGERQAPASKRSGTISGFGKASGSRSMKARKAGKAGAAHMPGDGITHASHAPRSGGQRQASEAADDLEDDIDGFIDDDLAGESWRMELQQITGYDPKKFAPVRDDRRMVASKLEMDREERLSKRVGRQDDERAEEEERAYRELKLKKKEKLRAKGPKRGSGGGPLWA